MSSGSAGCASTATCAHATRGHRECDTRSCRGERPALGCLMEWSRDAAASVVL